MLPNSQIREITIQDYLKVIKKRFWIIAAVTLIIPVSVAVFDLMTTPLFRVDTSIMIDLQSNKVKTLEGLNVYNRGAITDQITIITSSDLAEKVFEKLRLLQDPDFRNLASPISKLTSMVSASADKKSTVITISVQDTKPLRASLIANTLVEVYINRDVDNRNQALREAGKWLQDQLEDIRKKGEAAEKAVSDYSQKYKIASSTDAGSKQEDLLESLKQKKSELEMQLAEAQKRYKEKHPTVVNLQGALVDVKSQILEETQNLLNLKERLVQYNILRKEVESNQQLYNTMLTRSKEVGVSEKIQSLGIRVLSKAYPPDKPFKPNTKKDVLTSIIIAIFCGGGLAFLIEYLDSSIRTAEDISAYLELPFLGYIPTCRKDAKTDVEKSLICYQQNAAPVAESFRALRTAILFSFPEDKPLKTMVVTSSLPQEGKSFVAVNLALIFCQLNERVLLIDVDMRKPKINKSFNFELKPGMSTILTGNIDFDKAVKVTNIPRLSVITAGTIPPNPSELLHSNKLVEFIKEAQSKFDRIIFDSPPVLVGADSALLANKVDGVVFVIKGAATRLTDLVFAKKKLIEAKANIIGAVLNNLEPELQDHYYYYHYSYKENPGKKT